MRTFFLSLGSSTGGRERNLADAVARMKARGLLFDRVSSLYETEPVGENAGTGWYLNMAAAGRTDLEPRALVDLALSVEEEMGRQRTLPGGPRNIDIDVLMLGDAVVQEPGCEIPHPRMKDRRFVLEPLAEIAPGAIHAPSGLTVREMLARLDDPSVVRRVGTLEGVRV